MCPRQLKQFIERRLTVGAVAHAPRPFLAASFLRRRLTVGAVADAPRPSLAAVRAMMHDFNKATFNQESSMQFGPIYECWHVLRPMTRG